MILGGVAVPPYTAHSVPLRNSLLRLDFLLQGPYTG